MSDEWELVFGLNPNLNDTAYDYDADGNSNLQEYQTGTHPMVKIETVDNSSANVGNYSSIDVDTNNNVHISYYDVTNTNLKYASRITGTWVPELLDSAGNVGTYSSIALDSNNKVNISYYDVTNANLKYASKVAGAWGSGGCRIN